MAITPLSIKNAALIMIGETKLQAGQGGKVAGLANEMYELAVDEEFEIGIDWKFAKTRAQLNLAEQMPAFGWTYAYEIPAGLGCRRIIAMVDADGDDYEYDWDREIIIVGEREVDVLVTNEPTCRVRFIRFRPLPAQWPAFFRKCVYINVAAMLVPSVVAEDQLYLSIKRVLQQARADAERINTLEQARTDGAGKNLDEGNNDVIASAGGSTTPTRNPNLIY